MSKVKAVLVVGAVAAIGLTTWGYYIGLTGDLPSGFKLGVPGADVVSLAPGSCASQDVQEKVTGLVKGLGSTSLGMRISQPKIEALNDSMASDGTNQYNAAIEQCTESAQTQGKEALESSGLPDLPYHPDQSNHCGGLSPQLALQCYSALRPVEAEFDSCRAKALSANDDHTIEGHENFGSQRLQALSHAKYELKDIRTASEDKEVGSKMCVANLTASLPNGWGQGHEEISYKIETTSDGKFYITLSKADDL